MKMIKDILAKYGNFYVGGSGYTFQVSVDDFNSLIKEIWELEEANAELAKEIVEHCETKGLAGRQVFALTKRVDELVEERKGFKEFLQQTSDIDKRSDALIEAQEKKIEHYEQILEGISSWISLANLK
jgi:uncharacterized coiled-coil DUF342 family protein